MNLEQQRVGDYVLSERLRQDRTGSVYRASHVTRKSDVAVTILDDRYSKDPDVVARFKAEAGELGRIKHPGIVEVLDHGESPHGLYLVTEHLSGEALAERLKRQGRLSLVETQRIVGALASALAAAHRMRVVHRDLAADSVWLSAGDSDGAIKVMNLGLAKILAGPAAASGKGVDQRADIHALGSLAYEMLSGQAPAEGAGDGGETSQRKRTSRLSALGVAVPGGIEDAIMKALERKKKRRFSSMAEFARAFGVALPPLAQASAAPEPVPVMVDVKAALPPPPPKPEASPERLSTLAGVVAPLRKLGRPSLGRRQILVASAGLSAAALVIVWLVVRSGGSPQTAVIEAHPPQANRTVGEIRQPPAPPAPVPPAATSRVDEILALNQKAVSAYAKADIKAARALLQEADQLAVASGYRDAMVRAQTQVRLGALWIAGEKNPRVGRRYLAKAVAINPAVKLPASMMNPKVRKALQTARAKATVAKNRGQKRALKTPPARRQAREFKRVL